VSDTSETFALEILLPEKPTMSTTLPCSYDNNHEISA